MLGTFEWTSQRAFALCKAIEAICPEYGFHVGLTGGVLYKDGHRKDCDLLFYKIRQHKNPSLHNLLDALKPMGIVVIKKCGFVTKATYCGNPVDILFPEYEGPNEKY